VSIALLIFEVASLHQWHSKRQSPFFSRHENSLKHAARRDNGRRSKSAHYEKTGGVPMHPENALHSSFVTDSQSSHVAILTEPDCCHDEARMTETLHALKRAVETKKVDLVSIRTAPSEDESGDAVDFQERVTKLAKDTISLRDELKLDFSLVVNDNVEAAIASNADGVHVKEHNVDTIPSIREKLKQSKRKNDGKDKSIVVGTSCHSVGSGLASWRKFRPDYLFVGTCFLTQSHPEKVLPEHLEGPSLPGQVKRAIHGEMTAYKSGGTAPFGEEEVLPIIFAIGGIDELNCAVPVLEHGCDGVAVIRSVLQAEDPGDVVCRIKDMISSDE